MSDRISRMAKIIPPEEMAELLAEVCETLKRHDEALFEMRADVDGLIAHLTGPESDRFAVQRDKTRNASDLEHAEHIRLLDGVIQRLRGI